jgi:gamma-glutamylcyclotransferase (GGCT)/AIG2-like uncharacterized protein YtfP
VDRRPSTVDLRPLTVYTSAINSVSEYAFFYGTLMTPFNRPGRQRVDSQMAFVGRGSIRASLYDLGIYPAAIPADDGSVVWGEVYELHDSAAVLSTLDEIEGYQSAEPERSLYTRARTEVTLQDGRTTPAWAYFYNAPLGRAQRITSGDYLEHLNVKGS